MNYTYSNNILIFYFLAIAVLFISSGCNLGSLVFSIPFKSFFNILSQPPEIKVVIKKIATLGVLLLLLFFVFSYLSLIFIFVKKLQNFIYVAMLFFICGGIGYFLSVQKKLEFLESGHRFLCIDAAANKVVAKIKFKKFPEIFYQDLLACKEGQLKLYLNQRLHNDSSNNARVFFKAKELLKSTPVLFTQEDIELFLKEKELSLKIYGSNVYFELRDLKGASLNLRKDALYVDGKEISLDYDQAFFVSFYVMSLDGKIRRVYL